MQLFARQEELELLNRELEDTNRGVVALYAELDERADYLRRASELKTKFLSNVSHEFRTPLNSIISLARLLASTNRRDEAYTMLSSIYNWFSEGFDTPDLIDAKTLLDELSIK